MSLTETGSGFAMSSAELCSRNGQVEDREISQAVQCGGNNGELRGKRQFPCPNATRGRSQVARRSGPQ